MVNCGRINLPYGVFVEMATKERRNNGLPQDNVWIVCPDKTSVPAEFEYDRISRNGHRI